MACPWNARDPWSQSTTRNTDDQIKHHHSHHLSSQNLAFWRLLGALAGKIAHGKEVSKI
jgi:hypothetical protein